MRLRRACPGERAGGPADVTRGLREQRGAVEVDFVPGELAVPQDGEVHPFDVLHRTAGRRRECRLPEESPTAVVAERKVLAQRPGHLPVLEKLREVAAHGLATDDGSP